MNRQGTIKKIDGKFVWISLAPLGCCGGSGSGSCHCSSTTAEVEFKAVNSRGLPLSPGDFVEIRNPTKASWAGVVRLVGIPVTLLVLGLVFLDGWWAAGLVAASIGASLLFPQNRESGYPLVERVVPVADLLPMAHLAAKA